jgi:hypothetical protein
MVEDAYIGIDAQKSRIKTTGALVQGVMYTRAGGTGQHAYPWPSCAITIAGNETLCKPFVHKTVFFSLP